MTTAKAETRIKSFTDLDVWQAGHDLVIAIYRLTRDFPPEERFGLISQMRRCAVSITSNIAEGFSRETVADKIRFYVMAQGSLTELQNQLLIARDIGYLTPSDFQAMAVKTVAVSKLINGSMRYLRQTIRS